MDSTTTCSVSSSMVDSLPRPTTSSSATTLTEESRVWRCVWASFPIFFTSVLNKWICGYIIFCYTTRRSVDYCNNEQSHDIVARYFSFIDRYPPFICSRFRPFVFFSPTRWSILRTSSCCVETTSAPPSTESTDSTTNVSSQFSSRISTIFLFSVTLLVLIHLVWCVFLRLMICKWQASVVSRSNCGKRSLTASTACPLPLSSTRRFVVYLSDFHWCLLI